jgi:hypothetical protein
VDLTFQMEKLHEVRSEIEPLLQDHWDSVPPDYGHPFDPDWGAYESIESAGRLRIFTARHHGVLVGYVVAIVGPGLHSRQSLRAMTDLWYLAPHMRHGLHGVALLRWSEERLTDEGVDLVCHGTRQARVGKLLQRGGYAPQETVWVKSLRRDAHG